MSAARERNKRCACGSEKKFKHCCLGRRAKDTALTLDFGEPVAIDHMELDPATGKPRFFRGGRELFPVSARLERMYDRPKGPKFVNRAEVEPTHLTISEPEFLLQYDRVYSIDTNTRRIGPDRVSLAVVVLCGLAPIEPGTTLAGISVMSCLEFRNVTGKPENIAWRKAIELIQTSPSIDPAFRIAIIVDSDLDALASYNSGQLPITEDFFLPANYALVYASADTGKDQLSNRLIALCDKESSGLFNHLQQRDDYPELLRVTGQPYSHFRLWLRYAEAIPISPLARWAFAITIGESEWRVPSRALGTEVAPDD